jgi:hypothetical protein
MVVKNVILRWITNMRWNGIRYDMKKMKREGRKGRERERITARNKGDIKEVTTVQKMS